MERDIKELLCQASVTGEHPEGRAGKESYPVRESQKPGVTDRDKSMPYAEVFNKIREMHFSDFSSTKLLWGKNYIELILCQTE